MHEFFQISSKKSADWLYLPAENLYREFPSRLLLSACAAERGFSVILGKKSALSGRYNWLPPGIIIDKGLATRRLDQIKTWKRLGHVICVSEEESLGFYHRPEWYLKEKANDTVVSNLEKYFAWGEKQAELIRGNCPTGKSRVQAIGSPRVDILRPTFHTLFEEKANDIKNQLGDFILLPSNFANVLKYIDTNYLSKGESVNSVKFRRYITEPEKEFARHKEENLWAFIKAIHRIRKEYPRQQLVIRPHPSDDINFWESEVGRIPHVHVVRDNSAIPWLLAATAIFHHGCTTGVEAHYMGKPSVAFHPCYNKRFDKEIATMIGPVAYTEDSLIHLLAEHGEGAKNAAVTGEWLNDYIFGNYSSLASDRIVNELDYLRVAALDASARRQPNLLRYSESRLRKWHKKAKKKVVRFKELLLMEKIVDSYRDGRWGSVEESDVKKDLVKLQEATGRFDGVVAEQLDGPCFLISRP